MLFFARGMTRDMHRMNHVQNSTLKKNGGNLNKIMNAIGTINFE